MVRGRVVGVLALLMVMGTAACSREPAPAEAPSRAAKWTVKGTLMNVSPEQEQVTIKHQDIPGLMSAMTMAFRVKDAKILEGFSAGDAVEFVLEQTAEGLVVTSLKKIGAAAVGNGPATTYHGKGVVVLVNRKLNAVLLKHEGAGPLPAGELVLPVTPASQLEGLEDDTPVEFTLTMKNDQLVVSELKKAARK